MITEYSYEFKSYICDSFIPYRIIYIPVDDTKDTRTTIEWSIDNILDPKFDKIILFHIRKSPSLNIDKDTMFNTNPEVVLKKVKVQYEDGRNTVNEMLNQWSKLFVGFGYNVETLALVKSLNSIKYPWIFKTVPQQVRQLALVTKKKMGNELAVFLAKSGVSALYYTDDE
ncbi:hypothetical protein HDV04_000692 [Boothiomyces sp. JEL0838]|nr:hypothetical protein HDV04_000676 [Boothiomyces sp. JEL0838]KAJ3314326.1 hypothetical protein HDV04_000692 [Boothiomyces sp. JEL0838]